MDFWLILLWAFIIWQIWPFDSKVTKQYKRSVTYYRILCNHREPPERE